MGDKEKVVEEIKAEEGYLIVLKFFKKYIQPFLAIFIVVLLIMVVNGLYDYKDLQTEIKNSCGWDEDEKFRCYCRKMEVTEIERSFINQNHLGGSMNWDVNESGDYVRPLFSFENASEIDT